MRANYPRGGLLPGSRASPGSATDFDGLEGATVDSAGNDVSFDIAFTGRG